MYSKLIATIKAASIFGSATCVVASGDDHGYRKRPKVSIEEMDTHGDQMISKDGMRQQRVPSAWGSLYLRTLSHKDRRALGQVMRNYHTCKMRQMDRVGYENVLVLLRAITFDPKALEDLMEHQTEASEERLEYARQVLIAHLAAMSDAKRADFADALEQALERGPKRKKQP